LVRVLNLTLKKQWFDMILSGEKKEEYREVKDYWIRRLANVKGHNYTWVKDKGYIKIKNVFDIVKFKNGYAKDSPCMEVECKGIKIDQGKKKWGAPDYRVFVIKLGKILKVERIK